MLPVHEADLEDASSLTALAQALVDDEEYRTRNALGPLASEEMDGETVTLTGGSFTYFNAGIVDVEQERVFDFFLGRSHRRCLARRCCGPYGACSGGRPADPGGTGCAGWGKAIRQQSQDRLSCRLVCEYRHGLYRPVCRHDRNDPGAERLGILNEYVVLRTRAEHDALYESGISRTGRLDQWLCVKRRVPEDLLPESAAESASIREARRCGERKEGTSMQTTIMLLFYGFLSGIRDVRRLFHPETCIPPRSGNDFCCRRHAVGLLLFDDSGLWILSHCCKTADR